MNDSDTRYICPSSLASGDAVLLGVRDADGRLTYLAPAVHVDAEENRALRERFDDPGVALRFAAPCVEGKCARWTGSRCAVIDSALTGPEREAGPALPACSIRSSCRWFAQQGRTACTACPAIVTKPPVISLI